MQFFKHLTDPALKRLYKFVLKRMIGRFLANDTLDLDQLDVHLRAGKIELCDLVLNADVLNAELCAAHGLPFRVKKGYVGSVRVSISYANIMSESCLVEVDDIEIVLVPLTANDDDGNSNSDDSNDVRRTARHSSSITAANTQRGAAAATMSKLTPNQQQQASPPRPNEYVDEVSQEGLDFVASWIEQVTSKIKVTLSNVCLRLETGEQHNGRDVALLCRLAWAQFTDESANEVESVYAGRASGLDASAGGGGGMHSMAASAVFGISQKGIKFRGVSMELLLSPDDDSVRAGMADASDLILHPFLATDMVRQCYVQVKLSHYDALDAPAVDADIFFHSIRIVLQPQHFPELATLVDAFAADATKTTSDAHDRYKTATSMYQSICEQQPAWLDGDDGASGDTSGSSNDGAVNLSLREFARIEQLLVQYRETHDELRAVQRRATTSKSLSSPHDSAFAGLPRKMSAAESVESCGLSDLDDDESFYECDPGASSFAGNVHFGSTSIMAQSLYASAMYDSEESDGNDADAASRARSVSLSAARSSRQVLNRVKLHLLECSIALLYEDLPDDDDDDDEEDEDEHAETKSESADSVDRPGGTHGTPKASALPSVDGMERLEFTFKDTLCSALQYAQHAAISMSFGSVDVREKVLPRLSMDVDEKESAMLTTRVLQFVSVSPTTGRKVHLPSSLTVQLRLDFQATADGEAQVVDALALTIQAQPVLVEWDMHILDRAHRYMKLMEESSKAQAAAAARRVEPVGMTLQPAAPAKRLELTTDCVELALRFPMVSSDVIRFGASSKRGLCEDKLVLTLEAVRVVSVVGSGGVAASESRSDDASTAAAASPATRARTELPWLSEFDVSFDRVQAVLATPEGGNQRAARLQRAVMLTGTGDTTSLRKCTLTLRLQTPTPAHIRAAVASKQNLSQDADEHPDAATVRSGDGNTVSGDDNDGGRIGLNGWSLDAVQRTQQFEAAAAEASLFSVDVAIPHARVELLKATLDRLLVLVDALLLISPIDIDAHNEMLATAAARARLQPNYMSLNVVIGDGVLTLSNPIASCGKSQDTSPAGTAAKAECAQVAFDFAFEQLAIFQVSQWLGQLASRAHVSARDVTLLETNQSSHVVAPIVYRTPYGVCDAPMLFVGVDIIDQTREMREMKVALHLSHASLRYDVASTWLLQLLDLLLLEYPAPIIPLDSASMPSDAAAQLMQSLQDGACDLVQLAVPPKTVFTKLAVHFYDVLVDYAPPSLSSRLIVVLGGVRVSSNVVTGAVLQGYKVVATDLQLFLTHARTGYDDIDSCILGRERLARTAAAPSQQQMEAKKRMSGADTLLTPSLGAGVVQASAYPSLLLFFEQNGFLKMVTMDVIDVFVRALVPPAAGAAMTTAVETKPPAFPELSVELTLGTANIYACFDSFNTLVELLADWSDALAVDDAPADTTAYVGLDRVHDGGGSNSVSVVTNLHSTGATSRALGTSSKAQQHQQALLSSSVAAASASANGASDSFSSTMVAMSGRSDTVGGGASGIKYDRRSTMSSDDSSATRRSSGAESINVLAQIDEHAFSGGQHIFAGTHVSTDTEARLLRTRLDAIQRQKDRMVHNDAQRDDELTATQLRSKYRQDDAKPRVRINELVIEDYYAGNAGGVDAGALSAAAGDFLMEPEPLATTSTAVGSVSDPWFLDSVSSHAATALNTHSASAQSLDVPPIGSLPDKSAVLHSEQAARWLPAQQQQHQQMDSPSAAFLDAQSPPLSPGFEALDESESGEIFAMQDLGAATPPRAGSDDENGDGDEDDAFDDETFHAATSKHWWGLQHMRDVELSEMQTDDGTESMFSRHTDGLDDDSTSYSPLDRIAERDSIAAPPVNAMSMSFIGAGDDADTEVELDFTLDSDLQSKFNRLMDLESNGDNDEDDDNGDDDGAADALYVDGDDNDDARSSLEDDPYRRHRASYQEMSSPRPIVARQASFTSTASSTRAMSTTSLNQPTLSPPDEPTARWFYEPDDPMGADGGAGAVGPPSRIYPHHVEIPIGGAAASLSFGAKESDDAVKSIARENAARRVVAAPPVVITHVLLRDFGVCMRFFGGSDWAGDAQSVASRHALEQRVSGAGNHTASAAAVTGGDGSPSAFDAGVTVKPAARREKLLDALLDDYVPSASSTSLFGTDIPAGGAGGRTSGSPSLFGGSMSAPTGGATIGAAAAAATRKRSLKSGRKTEEMLELSVARIQLRLDRFNDADAQPLASSTVLALGDVEVLDYISTSQIRKVICYWKSDATHPRESGSSMVHVHLTTVRPGPNLCEEHRLRVTLLPLRINLDQEVVSFLRQFVPVDGDASAARASTQSRNSAGNEPFGISEKGNGADDDDDAFDDSGVKGMEGTEMAVLNAPTAAANTNAHLEETNVSLGSWFFQSIDVRPCKIKIDYRPNRVDYAALRAGDYLEVINLFVLEGMELVLRRVKMSGIDGWSALGEQVLLSWVNDISRHQIHKCVASVSMPPLRPFANIGSGAADLILLPMEHYGKDRRFVRGLKKGAKSFLKSVTIETLNTASRVAQGTQALLEHADDVVSTSSALRRKQQKYRQATSRIRRNSRRMGGGGIRSAQDSGGGIGGRQYLTQQPSNATEGLYQAYDSLSRELHVAAKTIVAVPLVEYKKTGSQGYVRSVIRAVPVAVLRPMIGATEAVSKALIGVRNAVDPELKEDIANKFKDFRGAY